MLKIKVVTIIGANGAMGSQCAGIIAGFTDATVYMISRDIVKSKIGIEKAIVSIKSDAIRLRLIPKTFDDLQECVSKSDWVFELASEDIKIKHQINKQISKYKKPQAIVSTVSSGLSINELAKDFSEVEQSYYFGTHFFNPPYKMILCELIPNENSNSLIQSELLDFLQNVLHRKVVECQDKPGFAGNRIGFQLLNEAIQLAEKNNHKGGSAYIDKLLGGFTGRAMPPIATVDLVGLDVHKAIVENIYKLTNDKAHDTLKLPTSVISLIAKKYLGNKTKQGFYKKEEDRKMFFDFKKEDYEDLPKYDFEFINQAKQKISNGEYENAFKIILGANTEESKIIQYFLARYISYSLSLVGTVVKTKEDVDKVMAYGFNWLSPCALVDLLGGKEKVIKLIKEFGFQVPTELNKYSSEYKFFTLQNELDFRSFIKAF